MTIVRSQAKTLGENMVSPHRKRHGVCNSQLGRSSSVTWLREPWQPICSTGNRNSIHLSKKKGDPVLLLTVKKIGRGHNRRLHSPLRKLARADDITKMNPRPLRQETQLTPTQAPTAPRLITCSV